MNISSLSLEWRQRDLDKHLLDVGSNPRPCPPFVKLYFLASFFIILAPWSVWRNVCTRTFALVTFSEIWAEPDLNLVLHWPKQQRPMAWITALNYKCPLLSNKFILNLQMDWPKIHKSICLVQSKISAILARFYSTRHYLNFYSTFFTLLS